MQILTHSQNSVTGFHLPFIRVVKRSKRTALFSQQTKTTEIDEKAKKTQSVVSKICNFCIRRSAADVSHLFQATQFNPPPLSRNGHIQTILGYMGRRKRKVLADFEWNERHTVNTPDGDFFTVDWKYLTEAGARNIPVVLICHGLQSNSMAPLSKELAMAFNELSGMDVACINFRGCCGTINTQALGYHLSFTDDLKLFVEKISSTCPGKKIYLSGFSLGANVVSKFLVELGTDAALKYNICGSAVNALPFDLIKIDANLSDEGISKALYGRGLLRPLTRRVLGTFEAQEYPFTKEELLSCKTIRDFDNLVVCSIYGFDGFEDYRRKSSVVNDLNAIAIPQLVVQALDDPFLKGDEIIKNKVNQPVRIQYTEHGGHCGYFFPFSKDFDEVGGWLSRELARFLKHVDNENWLKKNNYRPHHHSLISVHYSGKKYLYEKSLDTQFKDIRSLQRRQAAEISHSFQTRDFSPIWYARNPHFQTIMGALYRLETMYASSNIQKFINQIREAKKSFQWDKRQRMFTPDGDFFDIDWKFLDGLNLDDSEEVPIVII